jgi:hypothetical protein
MFGWIFLVGCWTLISSHLSSSSTFNDFQP